MRNRWFVLVLVLALVASACGGSDATDAETSAEAPEPTAVAEPDPTAAPAPEPEPEPEPTAESEPDPEPTAESEPEPTTETATETDSAPVALTSGCGVGATAGLTSESLEFEGRTRTFEQLLPSAYDDATPLPVVLNWHGLGSNGVEQLGFSDYGSLAESEGFIVIAPTGVPSPGDTNGRNSWELTPDSDPTRDDLAFANELLDTVIETLCVDDRRVYTTGMSNGGYFSAVLVCEMSDRIAAAAAVAALTREDDCDPDRAVPFIGFHGTDDEVVPYDGGGESSLAPGETIELFEREIPIEFGEFAIAAGCDIVPIITELSENVNQFGYEGCPDGLEMAFYEIEGAGHTWPGSLVSLAISEAAGLGVTTAEISASETSWEFFARHALPAE